MPSVREVVVTGIIESRFVPNARRTIRWTIIGIKYKVPFFHNKCPIFDKKPDKPAESSQNDIFSFSYLKVSIINISLFLKNTTSRKFEKKKRRKLCN